MTVAAPARAALAGLRILTALLARMPTSSAAAQDVLLVAPGPGG